MVQDDHAGTRLHLGCGSKKWAGWQNIDAYGQCADLVADLRKLPHPDNHADEIAAIHVFEHFFVREALAVLKEWHRVLKPGGRLTLELPCLDKIISLLQQKSVPIWVMFGLYGDPRTHNHIEDLHKWCWSKNDLERLLIDAGFREITFAEPQFHVQKRDMRVEAIK